MPRFERISPEAANWDKMISAFPDHIVFQCAAWIAYLAETQKGEPVLAVLKERDETLGCFVGMIVRKLGLKILGSPFRGWSTPYMGFCLRPGVSRRAAIEALAEFAFRQLGCIHLEMVDSQTTPEDIAGLGFVHEMHPTIEVDLTQSEEAIFNGMSSSCRRNIRIAEKKGVVVEEASDLDFADEFSAQLEEVFGKQGLAPNFGAPRVRALIKHLQPTGRLLLLRARKPDDRQCIASGFYPAMHETAYYNGGASWRAFQKLCPNELLHWYAMRYWKKRGMRVYNFVGDMEFKRRFGGRLTSAPMIYKSKYGWLMHLRAMALPFGRFLLRLRRKLTQLKGGGKSKPDEHVETPGREEP